MRTIRDAAAAMALGAIGFLGGCLGGGAMLPPMDDASYGTALDMAPVCTSNNDGVIDRSELLFPTGTTVHYLFNPPGTTVSVNPDGVDGPDGPEWDLTSTSGEVHDLTLLPIAGQWFAGSFPTASYATLSDVSSGILGVFQVTDDALLLLGFVSQQPNRTLLVYSSPIETVRFPLAAGTSWVTGAKITNGTLDGKPFASSDTYRISVDKMGVAVLPFLRFDHTLRVHVELSQALPGGIAVTHIQYLFFHECYGELGRMVSNAGETNPSFMTASELRRLAL